MNRKLRYALVGCGQAGLVHAYHFSRHPEIQPVACIDLDLEKAKKTANELGFEMYGENLQSTLANHLIDLISIATPPSEHCNQIEFAVSKGAHILCEKPLVLHPIELQTSLQACKTGNIQMGIMLPRRYYNNSLAVQKVLQENRLGKILAVSFDLQCRKEKTFYEGWRGKKKFVGGGVLISQAIHSIDQLVYFFGAPKSVECKTWSVRDYIDVEDEAEAVLHFSNNIQAKIRASTNSKEYLWRGITVIKGEKGQIILDSEKVLEWTIPGVPPPKPEEAEQVPEFFKPTYYGPGHKKVIDSFIDFLQTRKPFHALAHQSCVSLELIWVMYRSSELKKEIRFL